VHVCEECVYDYYTECDKCGHYHHTEHIVEHDGENICDDCNIEEEEVSLRFMEELKFYYNMIEYDNEEYMKDNAGHDLREEPDYLYGFNILKHYIQNKLWGEREEGDINN
jgi:hypothetical protein